MSGAANNQQLPQKEAAVFKTIVKFYETKQYKKGLKAADSILKKFPDHGETLAMKGLTLNCMDKKKDAYEHVRLGLKKNLTSHVCWHVYGLLYRSDRDYKEAIKCYKQALKRDKDNTQILRDLSLLQIQMRELSGFAETRRQLLTLNAKNRNNWIGFAIATHVAGDVAMALKILDSYESTMDEVKGPDYEHGEMLLYKNQIIEEMGDMQRTYDHLAQSEPLVLDKLALKEKKVELLTKLGRDAEAEQVSKELLAVNSENYNYHSGLLRSRGYVSGKVLDLEAQRKLLQLYKDLAAEIPRSNALKRMPLDFLTGELFREEFSSYVVVPLRKGVPSLFADLKPLYADESKVKIMEEVMLGYVESLRTDQALTSSGKCEVPCTLLWVLVYLAQHYDRKGLHGKALEFIDEAVRYTPTVIDLYLVRARIFKHAGDPGAASEQCEIGRKMDLADRFLNTMSVRYALKADRRALAESTVMLFTKDGDNPNNLYDMQCMWYEIEFGKSCLRTSHFGKALRKFMWVDKHFADMVEDQFDFHTYCLRKMTLRAYINLLRCEDTIYKHKAFVQAATGIITAYISLHDQPAQAGGQEADEEMEGLSEAEKKKLQSKRRRAEKKAQEEAKAAEEAKGKEKNSKSDDKKKGKGKDKEDDDPDGEKLVSVESPIEATTKFITLLQEHAGADLNTHVLSCDVYVRKGKLLKVLQAIKRAVKIAAEGEPDVHRCVVMFLARLETCRATLPPVVLSVMDAELQQSASWGMPGLGGTAKDVNEAYLAKHASKSLLHALAGAQSITCLDPTQTKRAAELINKANLGVLKHKTLEKVHRWMVTAGCEKAACDKFAEGARHCFPISAYFKKA